MDSELLGAGLMAPRQLRNCMPCKKRKIKCGPCSLRRDGKNCTPAVANLEETAEQTDAYVSVSDFKALARHVQVLRDKVKALETVVNQARGGSNEETPLPDEASPVTSRRHMGDDEMVFALEDFQMSHRVNTMRNRQTPDGATPALFPTAGDEATNHIGGDHPLAFVIPTGTDYLAQAIALLPDQQISARLVQEYFSKVEWFQRCLHYPTFMSECRQLWNGSTKDVSPDFVATYTMVLCLGLSTSSESFGTNSMALAEQLYHLAEGIMMCSRFLHRQTFESLQAISLMTIYGYGMEDGADATWALCGSAIKIAQNLGLNRLEAEEPGKVWTALWGSRLKREIGRRVWWCFVSLDWAHAIAHGSSYSVHPSQNMTALPANLDDTQLEDPTAIPHPLSVCTPINMHIFKCKFVTLYREITDHMTIHKTPSYSFILAMDDSIIDLARSLPPHFQNTMHLPIDASPALVTDSIFLSITANTRLVRLHRYFFIRGYSDERYTRSRERCVEAAQTVLRLLDLATRRAPNLLNFWIVLFYAFSAAVPVCIDLMFEPTQEKRQMVRRIIETLRDKSSTRPAARNSVFVLERLLEKEDEFRAGQPERPAKRRRGSGAVDAGSPRQAHLKQIKTAPFGASDLAAPTPADTQPPQSNPTTTAPLPLPDTTSAVVADPLDLTVGEWPGLHLDWFDSLWTQTDTTWPEMLDRNLG
ncbi:putative transcriptional regulatory protein [Vanrija pseudolonga]|uniref:Purtative transcriptional regulatory protein n=1 Tax=Vanrija pseudolonga TaxID=143232 RepID=A0AAF0YFB8_9TREE|nr:purtative transcriptional regulatory protein [Vanrija pseudolonga]